MTSTTNTIWRVSPVAWVPISLAILAETASNGLRAYSLGTHLERFTVTVWGAPVSIAGAVLVVAALAVSLAQARAAWVALTPGALRQRIVAGLAAVLLLAISVTALASHILDAQRAKTGPEDVARDNYDRAKAEFDKANAELVSLGVTRTKAAVDADLQALKIDLVVWKRSSKCTEIDRADTKTACAPALALYQERAAAVRKAELEPKVESLRLVLATLERPASASAGEELASGVWAWIMGLGVVFIATFGTVIFARVDEVPVTSQAQATPPTNGGQPHDIPVDHPVIVALRPGKASSNDELAKRLRESKGEATKKRGEVDAYIVERRVGKRLEIDLKPEVRRALG